MSIEGLDVIVVNQKVGNKKMKRELRDQEKVGNKKMKRELRDQEKLNSGALPKLKRVKESLHTPTAVGPAMAQATRQSGWKRSKVKSKGKGKRVNMEKMTVDVVYVYQRDQSYLRKLRTMGETNQFSVLQLANQEYRIIVKGMWCCLSVFITKVFSHIKCFAVVIQLYIPPFLSIS
jgi:hypothetical protein